MAARRSKAQEANPLCESEEFPLLTILLGQVEHELIWSFAFSYDCIPVDVFCVNKSIQRFCKTHSTTLRAAEFDVRSMEDMRDLGCTAVTSLDVSNMDWFDDRCLSTLARLAPKTRRQRAGDSILSPFPNLKEIDVSFCPRVTAVGVRALVNGLGNQLRGFHWGCEVFDSRSFEKMMNALFFAPALETLSLTMRRNIRTGGPLTWLRHFKNLRSLSVTGICPTSLPAALPALITLRIVLASRPAFGWPASVRLAYPMLETLEVEDNTKTEYMMPNPSLSSEILISWCTAVKFPRLRRVIIHKLPSRSGLSEEARNRGGGERARLVTALESRGVTCTFTHSIEDGSSDEEESV